MSDTCPDVSKSLEPAALSLVGLTPLLAVCTTLLSGLCMGLAFLAALTLSEITVSCVRRMIPTRFSLIYLLLIAATWVSVIDLLMQVWSYALREQLGIYLYLLAMNTTLLLHLETFPLRQGLRENILAGLGTAVTGVTLLTATGLIRELAGQGGVLTDIRLLAQVEWLSGLQPARLFNGGLHLFNAGAGAFIVFGLLLALRFSIIRCAVKLRPSGRGAVTPARYSSPYRADS